MMEELDSRMSPPSELMASLERDLESILPACLSQHDKQDDGGGVARLLILRAQREEWGAACEELSRAKVAANARKVEVHRLEKANEALRQEVADLRAALTDTKTLTQRIGDALRTAEDVKATQIAYVDKQASLNTLFQQLIAAHCEIGESQRQLDTRIATIGSSDAEAKLQSIKDAQAAFIKTYQESLHAYKTSAASIVERVRTLNQQNCDVASERDALQSKLASLTAKLSEVEGAVKQGELSLGNLKEQLSVTKEKLENEEVAARGYESDRSTLLTELTAARNRNVDLSFTLSKLHVELADVKADKALAETENNRLKADVERQMTELDGLRRFKRDTLQSLTEKDASLRAEKEKSSGLEQELRGIRKHLEESMIKNDLLSRQQQQQQQHHHNQQRQQHQQQQSSAPPQRNQQSQQQTTNAGGTGMGGGGNGGGRKRVRREQDETNNDDDDLCDPFRYSPDDRLQVRVPTTSSSANRRPSSASASTNGMKSPTPARITPPAHTVNAQSRPSDPPASRASTSRTRGGAKSKPSVCQLCTHSNLGLMFRCPLCNGETHAACAKKRMGDNVSARSFVCLSCSAEA